MSLLAPRSFRRAPILWLTALTHTVGLAAMAARPSTWPVALPSLFANHILLAVLGVTPRSRALGPNLRRLPAGSRHVSLTFDDGPDPEITPRVLDLIEAGGHRASFFLIGERAERHPGLAGELVARGHAIENHTHRHSSWFSFSTPASLRREIGTAQRVLTGIAGRPPRYFRAPAGVRSPWLEPVLVGFGLRLVSWTRRGFDTVTRDLDRVHRRLGTGLSAGDILMMHDRRLEDGRAPVLEVLPRLLRDLDRAGLVSRPLPSIVPED